MLLATASARSGGMMNRPSKHRVLAWLVCWVCFVPAALFAGNAGSAPEHSPAGAGRVLRVSQAPLPSIPPALQFRTLGEAAASVQPGDRVVVHGGVYRESV